jgi:pilus assembly protein Flp/PilA
MIKLLTRLAKDEDGAALAEYAILLGIITVAVIATIAKLGTAINNALETACNAINNNVTC